MSHSTVNFHLQPSKVLHISLELFILLGLLKDSIDPHSVRMALPTNSSVMLAGVLFLVVFASMQVLRQVLAGTQLGTIAGGFLGSWLFVFGLTFVSNLEMLLLGKNFQTKLVEVIFVLVVATFASSLVHRVSATTCILFSIMHLFYINRLSAQVYAVAAPQFVTKKKK